MIRAAVIAPALALRAGLRALLSAGDEVQVVAEAASVAELRLPPAGLDVLIAVAEAVAPTDLEELLRTAGDAPGLLLLGDEPDAAGLAVGLLLRAWGLVPIDVSAEELVAAVRAVAAGLLVGSPLLLEPLISRPLAGRVIDSSAEQLTAREVEVLQLLAQGLSNRQIAGRLSISEHTVKFHVSAIFAKLGAASRTEAVRLGTRRGLIVL